MRNARKLLLAAMAALAALAFAATTASAATPTPLEIRDEETGLHCDAVVLHPNGHDVEGGCLIHANSAGNVVLKKHVFGIESTLATCTNEFYGRVDETAEGYIYEQDFNKGGGACPREPCTAEASPLEEDPWEAHGAEFSDESPAQPEGNEFLTTIFCVRDGATEETCEIDVPFNHVGLTHQVEFGHEGADLNGHGIGAGFRCEVAGHWLTEENGTLGQGQDGDTETDVKVHHENDEA